jgi:hypothetical protein
MKNRKKSLNNEDLMTLNKSAQKELDVMSNYIEKREKKENKSDIKSNN